MYMRCPHCNAFQLTDDWCHRCGEKIPRCRTCLDIARMPCEDCRKTSPRRMKLRLHLSHTRRSETGKHALEFGLKVGYWPCLKGPFISVAFGFRRLDFWYGLPSYWQKGEAPPS